MDLKHQNLRFDEWMAEHSAILHRTVNGFATGEERKDLMQETMLAVWKAVPAFREHAKASTFIYRVAHNAALTWKRSRTNYHSKLDRFEAMTPPVTHEPTVESDQEQLEALYAAIRRLEPLDRSLALLFLDDVSYREIAEIHGMSESNVGVRLNRLKQKLAAMLKEAGHGN